MWSRLVRFLLPALEARRYRREVMGARQEPAAYQALWKRTYDEMFAAVGTAADLELAEKLADKAFEAELKRKETLEAKAATFVSSPTIATVITAASAVMTWSQRGGWLSVVLMVLHLLALIHLTLSTYFAVAARAEEPFVVHNAGNALRLSGAEPRERVAGWLAFSKMNEPLLLLKVNNLALAEVYFVRGLFIVAVGVVLTAAARWLGP